MTFIRKREALCPHEYTCRIDYAHRRNMGHALFICFPRVLGGLVTNPCTRKLFPLITSIRSFMPIVRTNVCGTHILLHTYSAHRLYTSFIRDVYGNIYPTRSRVSHANIISLFLNVLFVSANLSVNIRLF